MMFLMISSLWSDIDMHILFLLILIIFLATKNFFFSPLNISWTDRKIVNFKKGYSLFLIRV